MNWHLIGTLAAKDVSLYFRNKLFTMLTILGLVMFIVIYFVMPKTVDATYQIGVYAPELPPVFGAVSLEEGIEIETVASEEVLKEAVLAGNYIAGASLPAGLLEQIKEGNQPSVTLFFTPDAPDEVKEAVELMVRELMYRQSGQTLSLDISSEILGQDTIGSPLAQRDRMLPLLAVFILVMEMLGLANQMAEEVQKGTGRALLVTPVSVSDVFVAKGIAGTGLAFIQAVLFLVIVGGLSSQAPLVLVALLLGAVMVTGLAYIIASVSKDLMSVLGWGMLVFIISVLPSLSVAAPGLLTGWIKIIPSYFLVNTVHRAVNYGSGWGDLWTNLAILLGICVIVTVLGIYVLRRKFR